VSRERLIPGARFCARNGATVNLGPPAARSEAHLSGDTVNDQPNGELSTWSTERLEARGHARRRSKGPGNGRLEEPCPC
jgi:hypothetical protein